MAFQPGNTYGKGRPKNSGRIQFLKEWAEKKGLKRLLEIADAEDPGIRIHPVTGKVIQVGWSRELQFEALKLALAYGLGKPTESVDITTGGETITDWALQYFGTARNGTTNGTSGHRTDGHGGLRGDAEAGA